MTLHSVSVSVCARVCICVHECAFCSIKGVVGSLGLLRFTVDFSFIMTVFVHDRAGERVERVGVITTEQSSEEIKQEIYQYIP